jgi:hypothetical protein
MVKHSKKINSDNNLNLDKVNPYQAIVVTCFQESRQ